MMKEEMHIYLLGHCEKCGHIVSRNVKVSLDGRDLTPCECPECHEGTVHFEKLAVHHTKRKKEKGSVSWIGILFLLLIALTVGTALWATVRINRDYSAEDVGAVSCTILRMSSADILAEFQDGGIKEQSLARILGASHFTIRRLKSGESYPTPSMEAAIRGLYSDYLLLGRSNILFRLRYSRNGMDQYYAFPNPLQEISSR